MTKKEKYKYSYARDFGNVSIIIFISLSVIILSLVIFINIYYSERKILEKNIIILNNNLKNLSEQRDYSEDIDLKRVVERTQDIAKTWFHYNMSNLNMTDLQMSADKFKAEGGVCNDYASYFNNEFKDLGFNTAEITLEELNHRFLLVWDNSSTYCLIDQLSSKCIVLG